MPGDWINDIQRALYMTTRQQGDAQATAAARSGFSERSGRRIEHGEGVPEHRKPRTHRTRKDPLEEVWEPVLVPMLNAHPNLKPVTLLEYLQEQYPGQYPNSLRRTLERRIKKWRATCGPAKEVMFRQIHQPGLMGICDFTNPKQSYNITIGGNDFKHILFHFRMPFSGWRFVSVVEGGESIIALTSSLNQAFYRLGGTPQTLRTDSLSAAYKNLSKDEKEDYTQRYQEFCEHYGLRATRNNRGVSHENGAIESPHGHLKSRIGQALMLRNSCDFDSIASFQQWLDTMVSKLNQRCRDKTVEEHASLHPLPPQAAVDYDEVVVRPTSSSTIVVKRSLYTVPSQLQGEQLRVHVHARHLSLFLGCNKVLELRRVFSTDAHRARNIDYRHVIESLVAKPQAFRHSVLRNDLLPNDQMRTIWQRADAELDSHFACKFMVQVLHISAKKDCLEALGEWLLKQKKLPNLHRIRTKFYPAPQHDVEVQGGQHNVIGYDEVFLPRSQA